MPSSFWRPILLTCALLLTPSAAAQDGSDPRDPRLEALRKVQAEYEQKLEALGTELLQKLDEAVAKENAKAPAERDLEITQKRLEFIAQDRASLLERGEWPASISVAEIKYHWVNDQRAKVRSAYQKAVAAAAEHGDAQLQQKLVDELALFDSLNDLAPWQDLSAWADLGQGEKAWLRVGGNFTCPAKGSVGGARNPLRFRRAFPSEYEVRFTLQWIEGGGGLVLGLVDPVGQQFEIPVPWAALKKSGESSLSTGDAPSPGDTRHVVVHALTDRLWIEVDGRVSSVWSDGQDFPVATDPPGAEGAVLYLGSNDADTRFKVLSAELKCLTRPNAAPPRAHVARPATQTEPTDRKPPPEVAVRYDKPAVLASLLRGIDWLIRHQDEDGGWKLESYTQHCPDEMPCREPGHVYSREYDPGVSGLATLALWRIWEQVSKSVNKDPIDLERIHAAALAGTQWFTRHQKSDGSFSPGKSFVYNEALSTLALAEAYRATQDPEWKEPAQRAVDFMMRAQRPSPNPSGGLWGWRYASRMEAEDPRHVTGNDNYERELHESDTSATGWAVLALRCAQNAKLVVHSENLDGALEFVKFVTAENGLVGYMDPHTAGQLITGKNDQYVYHPAGMSALAICIRLFSRQDPNDRFIELAARRVALDMPLVMRDKLSIDYYYWYCGTVALDQFDGPDSRSRGGKYWNPWNKALIEALLQLQNKVDEACSNGAWLVPDRWSFTGGPIYATAINALTLEDALGWK